MKSYEPIATAVSAFRSIWWLVKTTFDQPLPPVDSNSAALSFGGRAAAVKDTTDRPASAVAAAEPQQNRSRIAA